MNFNMISDKEKEIAEKMHTSSYHDNHIHKHKFLSFQLVILIFFIELTVISYFHPSL